MGVWRLGVSWVCVCACTWFSRGADNWWHCVASNLRWPYFFLLEKCRTYKLAFARTHLQKERYLQPKVEPAHLAQAKLSCFWQTHRKSPDASWESFASAVQRHNVYRAHRTKWQRDEIPFEYFCRSGEGAKKKKKSSPATIACGLCFVWVCVHLIEGCVFWDSCLCQSFPHWWHVWASTFVRVCARGALTTAWFIPSFSNCCCLGPTRCHAYAQRSLCNWNGPLKAPCHMETGSLGCLYVHPSIFL